MLQKGYKLLITTPQQRKLLFETWQVTGNVTQACRQAKVARATFYYWKPRFQEQGFRGLEEPEIGKPHEPNRKNAEVERRVIELRHQHPDWGKTRIADEFSKPQNGGKAISPNTVRRILRQAGMWAES